MSRKLTYQPKPKWCKGCKKTARVVRYKKDGAFVTRCRQCAESDGRTVVDNRANNGHKSKRWAKRARQIQLHNSEAQMRANQARRVKALQRARRAAERQKKALMDGMMPTVGIFMHLTSKFSNGICRGCKGRLPIVAASYILADSIRQKRVPTVLCRECAE